MNVNRMDLVDQLASKYDWKKKDAKAFIDDFCKVVLDNLEKGNSVTIYGFGSFEPQLRAERSTLNPQTKEPCVIPAHWIPRFHPGKFMKQAIKRWEEALARGDV